MNPQSKHEFYMTDLLRFIDHEYIATIMVLYDVEPDQINSFGVATPDPRDSVELGWYDLEAPNH